MELNAASGTNDQLIATGALTYGGTLVLKNLGGTLAANQTFKVFTAGSFGGSFSSVVSDTPGQTITWDISQLAANGTVKVASAAAAPVTITPVISGGSLTLSWATNQFGWSLQQQINPWTAGIGTNWTTIAGSNGTNQMTFPIDHTKGSVFFRLVFP